MCSWRSEFWSGDPLIDTSTVDFGIEEKRRDEEVKEETRRFIYP
jgi:hypothetical protein